MLEVVAEVIERFHLRAYLCSQLLVVKDDILEGKDGQFGLRLQLEVLAEAIPAQVVHPHDMPDILVTFDQAHHRRSREDDMQRGVMEEAVAQLFRPIGIFEDLVQQQRLTALFHELTGKVIERVLREIEVVEIDVQGLACGCRVFLQQFLSVV